MAGEARRIETLDWLRAVAITLVLVHHIGRGIFKGYLPPFLGESWTGVDLFFVLSGYLVTHSFSEWVSRIGSEATMEYRGRIALRYALRRFLRILPPAWLWAALPMFAASIFNRSGGFGRPEELRREFLGVLSFSYNYFTVHTGLANINYFWSLAVEEHFYLVLPFFLVFVRNRSRRLQGLTGLVAISGALKLWAVAHGESPSAIRFLTHFRVDALAIGSVLGLLDQLIRNGKLVDRFWPKPAWLMTLFASLCVSYLSIAPAFLTVSQLGQFGLISFSVVSAALLVIALQFQPRSQNLFSSLTAAIGRRSYSLYLVHLPVYHAMREARFRILGMESREPWPSLYFALMELILCILLLLAINELSYRWVELPLIQRGRAWFPRPKPYL